MESWSTGMPTDLSKYWISPATFLAFGRLISLWTARSVCLGLKIVRWECGSVVKTWCLSKKSGSEHSRRKPTLRRPGIYLPVWYQLLIFLMANLIIVSVIAGKSEVLAGEMGPAAVEHPFSAVGSVQTIESLKVRYSFMCHFLCVAFLIYIFHIYRVERDCLNPLI